MRQLGLACFLVLLILSVNLPNAGKVVIDHTTTPATAHIVGRLQDSLVLIGLVGVPFAMILGSFFRLSWLAIPDWILLASLFIMAFMKGT